MAATSLSPRPDTLIMMIWSLCHYQWRQGGWCYDYGNGQGDGRWGYDS